MIRPDRETFQRRYIWERPTALAATEGPCPGCGEDVTVNEPIVLPRQPVVQDPDGSRHVDLSGAEWMCQRPHAGVSA